MFFSRISSPNHGESTDLNRLQFIGVQPDRGGLADEIKSEKDIHHAGAPPNPSNHALERPSFYQDMGTHLDFRRQADFELGLQCFEDIS